MHGEPFSSSDLCQHLCAASLPLSAYTLMAAFSAAPFLSLPFWQLVVSLYMSTRKKLLHREGATTFETNGYYQSGSNKEKFKGWPEKRYKIRIWLEAVQVKHGLEILRGFLYHGPSQQLLSVSSRKSFWNKAHALLCWEPHKVEIFLFSQSVLHSLFRAPVHHFFFNHLVTMALWLLNKTWKDWSFILADKQRHRNHHQPV